MIAHAKPRKRSIVRTLRIPAAALLLALLVGVAACGGDDKKDEDSGRPGAKLQLRGGLPEALRGPTTAANPRLGTPIPLGTVGQRSAGGESAALPAKLTVRTTKPGRLVPAQEGQPGGSEAEYDRFVKALLPVINAFWVKQTAKVSPKATYNPPGHIVSYNGEDGPGCAGRKGGMAKNAYYCSVLSPPDQCKRAAPNRRYCLGDDIIAWDKAGLMLPFYRQIGDLAVALALSHEWGHLAQARVFPQFTYETGIRVELQADCYAGAWAQDMYRKGRLDIGEFSEALETFQRLGKTASPYAWLDPDSHGNGFQRFRAFTQGFEEGTKGCLGNRFDSVLRRIGLARE
jgi:hypothetical protein